MPCPALPTLHLHLHPHHRLPSHPAQLHPTSNIQETAEAPLQPAIQPFSQSTHLPAPRIPIPILIPIPIPTPTPHLLNPQTTPSLHCHTPTYTAAGPTTVVASGIPPAAARTWRVVA